jgi:NAD(P)-dependent dehydrogenase (short-subunit alcohol dehydrogenase family)
MSPPCSTGPPTRWPVDAFVSNAGIIHKAGPLADIPVEDIRRVVDVDLTAHLVCLREAVRRMARSRGRERWRHRHHLLHGLRARRGRRLHPLRRRQGRDRRAHQGPRARRSRARASASTASAPGLIDTDIQDDTGIEGRIARFGSTVPIGRAGTTEEVAEAVCGCCRTRRAT